MKFILVFYRVFWNLNKSIPYSNLLTQITSIFFSTLNCNINISEFALVDIYAGFSWNRETEKRWCWTNDLCGPGAAPILASLLRLWPSLVYSDIQRDGTSLASFAGCGKLRWLKSEGDCLPNGFSIWSVLLGAVQSWSHTEEELLGIVRQPPLLRTPPLPASAEFADLGCHVPAPLHFPCFSFRQQTR